MITEATFESSVLEEASYNHESGELAVVMVLNHKENPGFRTYRFKGVPSTVWENLLAAPSSGTFFNKVILQPGLYKVA